MNSKKFPNRKKSNFQVLSLTLFICIIGDLNKQRTIVNELEENLNEKKRKFKFDIKLVDERKNLEDIDNLDPS